MRVEGFFLGRVQGVGFRATTRDAAQRHGLTGWVRNEPDGSVALVAEGPDSAVEAFLTELRTRMRGRIATERLVSSADPREQETLLRQRFAELGPRAECFLDGLLRDQRYGKRQAFKTLALQSTYARVDLLAALERAVRFGAFSLDAVERILAASAKPQSILDALADRERERLPAHLRDEPVTPRPTTAYRTLGEHHDAPPEADEESSDNRI